MIKIYICIDRGMVKMCVNYFDNKKRIKEIWSGGVNIKNVGMWICGYVNM